MSVVCVKVDISDSYHTIDCCDKTLGIDNLLYKYQTDRDLIINMMIKDPNKLIKTIWSVNSPLAVDNNCLCKMSKRSYFMCAQCKNLSRIMDFRIGINNPFRIECGTFTGKQVTVSETMVPSPFLEWDNQSSYRAKKYRQQYEIKTSQELKCITGDNFTIQTLINWIISDIFIKNNLNHVPNLYTSFICNNIGYSLTDNPIIEKKSSITKSIILQLLVILTELAKYDFYHGDPSLKSLIFTKDPVSYKYENLHIEGPITVKIDNLSNSSINFHNIRYFSNNNQNIMYIERNTFVPEINTMKLQNKSFYKLTSNNIDIYNAMRHIGVSLFSNSFNFYCFMISLMCNKHFYNDIVNNTNLYGLWEKMWLPENLDNVNDLIIETHEMDIVDTNIIFDIIKGFWLRSDIVSYMWSLMK